MCARATDSRQRNPELASTRAAAVCWRLDAPSFRSHSRGRYLNGELAKKTDEILELQERVAQLEDENASQALEHEKKLMVRRHCPRS